MSAILVMLERDGRPAAARWLAGGPGDDDEDPTPIGDPDDDDDGDWDDDEDDDEDDEDPLEAGAMTDPRLTRAGLRDGRA